MGPVVPPRRVADDVPTPRWAPTLEISATAVPAAEHVLQPSLTTSRLRQEAVQAMIDGGGPAMVFQPQLSLSRLAVSGYEALARFPRSRPRGPEFWFGLAREVGLAAQLEASAVRQALLHHEALPPGATLAVNVSPSLLGTPELARVLPADLTGVEIEITEHEHVTDVKRLRRLLQRLRERGARLAIDDVGAGHSGLRRVMELAPDSLKLDRQLVVGVADNSAKAALIRAVVDFTEQIGATVCAEGVETLADLLALADLGVGFAQGWAIGRPAATFRDAEPDAVAAGRRSLARALTSDADADAEPAPVPLVGPSTDIEAMLDQATTVTGLADLVKLAAACAPALDSAIVAVGRLRADGTIEPLTPGHGRDHGWALRDHPAARRCLEHREIVQVYADPAGDEPSPAAARALTRLGYGSALLVPLVARDRAVGLLEAYRHGTAPWSRRQIRSFRTLAAVVGPVLDGLRVLGEAEVDAAMAGVKPA